MAEKTIFFHATTREIQCPSGGLDYLSLSPVDTLYVTNSEKNDGAYTVTRATDTQIFVAEEIKDELNTAAVLTKPTTPGIPFKVFPIPEREPEPRPAPTPPAVPPQKITRPAPELKPTLVAKPPEFVPQTEAGKSFAKWAEGRTGFSKGELAEIYASSFGLAPEALKKLEGEIGIKATEKLKPREVKKPAVPPQKIKRPAPDLLITRTPYPKWWKDSYNSVINFSGPGSQTLASVSGKLRLFVATIVITVTGETQITIGFGNAGASGPIFLGGEGQPMGMVVAMGNSPAPCGTGQLSISATGDPLDPIGVGGFATVFVEQET